jgi:hypothetical protein
MTTAPLWYILLVLIGYVLTGARLTRLVVADAILDPARIWLLRHSGGRRETVEYFIGCPWCVGFWLCLALAPFPVSALGLSWWWVLVMAAACSQIVGMTASIWNDEDIEVVEE